MRRRIACWTPCLVLAAGAAVAGAKMNHRTTMAEKNPRQIDFESPDSVTPWFSVDDRVMGGISRSRIRATGQATAVFEGVVSKENNGGFASVRTELPEPWSYEPHAKLKARVRGDGRRYELVLRSSDHGDRILYRRAFDTVRDEWIVVELDLESFRPTWRGRPVPQAGPLDADIVGLGLLVAPEDQGFFQLEVDWIGMEAVRHD